MGPLRMTFAIGTFVTLSILFVLLYYYQRAYRLFRLRMSAITGKVYHDAKDWQSAATEQLRARLLAKKIPWKKFILEVLSLFLGAAIFGYSITRSFAVAMLLGGILGLALPFRKLRKRESAFDYAHCISLFEDVIPKGSAAMDLDGNVETAIRDVAKQGESPTGRRLMGKVNQWHKAGVVTPGEYLLQVAEEEGHPDWIALAAITAAVEQKNANMSKVWEQSGRMMRQEWEAREEFQDYFQGFRQSANIVFGVIVGIVIAVQTLVHLAGGRINGNIATCTLFGVVILYLAARYVLDRNRVED